MNTVNLKDIADGALQEKFQTALQEKFQTALQEVFCNMQDPNTSWRNKREIVIKLKFVQNEDRDDVSCEISVEKKLAQTKPVGTKFAVGKDLSTGEVEAAEYGPGIKGQMSLEDYQEEDKPQGGRDNVVDFRDAR